MRAGLQARLLGPTLLVVLISMAAAGFVSNRKASDELWNELQSASTHMVAGLHNSLGMFVANLRAMVILKADEKIISDALAPGAASDVAVARDALEKMKQVSTAIQAVNLLSAAGDVVASSDPKSTGNFGDREYFKIAMAGETNISSPLISRVTGKPVFMIAAPVKVQGKIAGVLYARVDIAAFAQALVEPVRIGKGGYAFMVDRNGVAISHPNPDFILKFDVKEYEWGRAMLAQEAGSIFYSFNGKEKAAVFNREPLTGWTVALTINREDVEGATRAVGTVTVLSQIGGGLVVCLVILWLVRQMVLALRGCVVFAEAVAGGQLDGELSVRRNDEIGTLSDALRSMVGKLRSMIEVANQKSEEAEAQTRIANEATDRAQQALQQAVQGRKDGLMYAADKLEGVVAVLSSASEELAAQIDESRRGSQDQAVRMGEMASAMEQMNGSVMAVAKNAAAAAKTSSDARGQAERGAQIVGQVVQGIGQVDAQARNLKEDMRELGSQAESIGHILNVISDIADQTNLLALNAAIEAARAGDAGRGFAVVADEVRKLAEKTMAATKEVDQSIRSIQSGTRKNVDNVEKAVTTIAEATSLAQSSQDALRKIVHLVDETTDQVRSIATASEEQSTASDEITRNVDEIRLIADTTSSSMNESAQAVGEVASQSSELRAIVNNLRQE